MFSFWERESFCRYDHIVIGAGIVGLSTAIELRALYPDASIIVLERGMLPTGASTRNAGFACMGSVTELLADLQHMSEEEVISLFEQRKLGLEILRSRLGDKHIGYTADGSYELISKKELPALDKIEYLNSLLQPIVKQPAFRLVNEKIKDFGFATGFTKALIENTCEGAIDTGKMMRVLMDYAHKKDILVKTGAEVFRYDEGDESVSVEVADAFKEDPLQIHGKTLSLCTNAFTKQLMHNADITPGRGQVLVTQPIDGLKFKGIFHFDEGFYYFREVDGRIMIGGGRNEDVEFETTTELGTTYKIQSLLEEKLDEIIIPGTPYEVDIRWSGIMAFGKTKQPVIQQFSDRVFGAFGMGGMGIAIGSLAGRKLAGIIRESL